MTKSTSISILGQSTFVVKHTAFMASTAEGYELWDTRKGPNGKLHRRTIKISSSASMKRFFAMCELKAGRPCFDVTVDKIVSYSNSMESLLDLFFWKRNNRLERKA